MVPSASTVGDYAGSGVSLTTDAVGLFGQVLIDDPARFGAAAAVGVGRDALQARGPLEPRSW
jgi:hypothetical protein